MIVKLIKRSQWDTSKISYLTKLPDKIQIKATSSPKDRSITYYMIDWNDQELNNAFKYYFKSIEDAEKLIEKLYTYQFDIFDVEKEIKSLGIKLWN